MKIFNKLIFWIFGIAFLVSCRDDMAPQLPEPVVETPEVGERPELKQLHVDGRYLVDADGQTVNLHGFAQTYSPFFNNNAWGNYDVDACLRYNQLMTDRVLAAGWEVNFIRQHMDPYWSSPGASSEAEAHMFYNEERFRKYLDIVFVPMAEFAISRGFYVVMRPPGVCPEEIKVGDKYQEYLVKIWDIVTEHPTLKNNPYVMFELANEPVRILDPEDGSVLDVNTDKDKAFTQLSMYFQKIVDTIRENGCDNILWIPGLGYQSQYAGYAVHPIVDPVNNYGFAIHVYPGWYGSDGENEDGGVGNNGGYVSFQNGWDNQVGPVAETHPIMVTEMDWAPKKYNASWGKATTGEAGGAGFGANFKLITDNSGNVSWLLFTGQEYMAEFVDVPGVEGEYTFLNDPEACPWPIYHWYQEYAGVSAEDYGTMLGMTVSGVTEYEPGKYSLTVSTKNGKFYLVTKATYESGKTRVLTGVEYVSSRPDIFEVNESGAFTFYKEGQGTLTVKYTDADGEEWQIVIEVDVTSTAFLFDSNFKNLVNGASSFNAETNTLSITGWEIFGWGEYNPKLDLSDYKYIVCELEEPASSGKFLVAKQTWSSPAQSVSFNMDNTRYIINLQNLQTTDFSDQGKVESNQIGVVGFQGTGSNAEIKLHKVYVTNEWPYEDKTVTSLDISGLSDNGYIYANTENKFTVTAHLSDGSTVDATGVTDCELTNPTEFSVKGGVITASATNVKTDITFKFGPEDNLFSKTISNISAIEITGDERFQFFNFNPNIFGTGTISLDGVFTPEGTNNCGGWVYPEGLDLSGSKYLVAEIDNSDGSLNGVGIDLRLFDMGGYWSGAAEYSYNFAANNKAVVDLQNIYKNSNNTKVYIDPHQINIVGFWTLSGKQFKISNIYTTDEWPFANVSQLDVIWPTSLAIGGESLMSVKAAFEDGSTRDVTYEATYESSDPSIISVDKKGYLKGVAEGKTTVTVTFGDESVSQEVTVSGGAESLTAVNLPDKILQGKEVSCIVYANFTGGTSLDFTSAIEYESTNTSIFEVAAGGNIKAISPGKATLRMKYLETTLEKEIEVVSSVGNFDIVGGWFNPRITGESEYDYATGVLKMTNSGLIGWKYDNAINLTSNSMKYLVAELSVDSGDCWLLIGIDNEWGAAYQTQTSDITTIGDKKYIVIDVTQKYIANSYNGAGTEIDPTAIKMVALQSYGSTITIKKIYLSGSDPTAE